MKTKEVVSVWRRVFGNGNYTLLALGIAVLFYLVNAIISNLPNIANFVSKANLADSLTFLFTLIAGFHRAILPSSVVTIVVLALLTGMLFSLLMYRFNVLKERKKSGFIANVGLFLGILVPGCAPCGIGLAALLGIGSSLAVLPFQGREISYVAIALLALSILKISSEFLVCKDFNTLNNRMKRGTTS